MEEKILETIKKYKLMQEGDKIIVGVSGGPDSICLLNALETILKEEKIYFKLFVAHVNHGIRKEAKQDAEFVKEYCIKNKIPCFIKEVNILEMSSKNKIGTEEAGRKVRYEFFNEILKKVDGNKIATAHTKNDNVETVLMNLIRGTGISGLKGIDPIRDNIYIRPLIECDRKEIEDYCIKHKLNPRIDKTNFENTYTRNKIRNLLIPYVQKEFNPNIIEAISRLSNIAREENLYFEKIVINTYKDLKIEQNEKEIILDLKKFNQLEEVIKNRIILYTISELLGNMQGIEKVHIRDIILLCNRNIGNKFLIPNKKVKILVKDKKIFFISNK